MEQQDAGGAWVTVAEAAGLLGVSTQAIRKRIARGTIDVRRNNRGQEVVQAVPASGPRTRQPVPKEVAVRTQPEPQPDGTASGHVSLDDARAMVAEACERQERAHLAELDRLRVSVGWERVWFCVVLAIMAALVLVPLFAHR